MADYAIYHDVTSYGMELAKSDPSFYNRLSSEVDTKVRSETGGNYGISYVTLDLVGGNIFYDIEPLTVSAKEEVRMASLGWWEDFLGWVKRIIEYALPVVIGAVFGFIVGGPWGALAGAVIGSGIALMNYATGVREYKEDILDIDEGYFEDYQNGLITWEQYNELYERKHTIMESDEEISWKTIAIYGLIGLAGLYAASIVLKK